MTANGEENHLDGEALARYDRQICMPAVGRAGQERLAQARVLVVGAGGLGSPAALYLAAAGVGTLGIVDPDRVELGNLNRQLLHGTADVGEEKTVSAARRLRQLNPRVAVETFPCRLDADNAADFVGRFDLALGCVDNFVARYALNAACARLGKANIFGAAMGFEGQAGVFCLADGPCYRCLFRDPPPEEWRPGPLERGVLGVTPGIIGCIQAAEAVKILLGRGVSLSGRLLLLNGLTMSFREIRVKKDPECPVCSRKGF